MTRRPIPSISKRRLPCRGAALVATANTQYLETAPSLPRSGSCRDGQYPVSRNGAFPAAERLLNLARRFQRRERRRLDPPVAAATIELRVPKTKGTRVFSHEGGILHLRRSTVAAATIGDYRALPGVENAGLGSKAAPRQGIHIFKLVQEPLCGKQSIFQFGSRVAPRQAIHISIWFKSRSAASNPYFNLVQ